MSEDKNEEIPEEEITQEEEVETREGLSSHSNDLNNTQYLTDESDDDFVDYSSRGDSPLQLLDKKDLQQNNDRIPLIPTDFTSIAEAIQNFTAVFESRYGAQHAPFYNGALQKAITDAFDSPIVEDRRPLALYLHNDDAVGAHIFAQNVLCSSEVSSLLKCQFVVWAWDMTQQQNRQTFFEWMNVCGMNLIAEPIRMIPHSKFPILIVILKDRGQLQRVTTIYGQEDCASTIQKLMEGLDAYLMVKEQDKKEERNRIEREQFRREQAEEYQQSLAADRAKQAELNKKKELEKEEEQKKHKDEEEKKYRLSQLAKILPAEPAETNTEAITIRFRCPNGDLLGRRFKRGESIEMLIIYAETHGFEREHFRLWTSDRPRKEVSQLDTSKSFDEIGWPKREQITIEEM